MDRIVEQLVRQIVAATRRGDDTTRLILWSRLNALATEPGAHRAFGRAIAIVDTRP